MLLKSLKLAGMGVICALLLACSSSEDPIKIGTNVWPGYALYYLAQDQGYISSEHVRLIEYQNATFVSEAFINGGLDAAMLTLDEALRIQELGIGLTIIQIIDVSRGADVVMSQRPLMEINDFEGKTIAVERSAVGALMLSAFEDHFDIPAQSLTVIDSTVEQSVEAFEQGIDFIVTFVPFSEHVASKGGYQVFDTSLRPNLVVDVLVVKDYLLASKFESALMQVIDGFFKGYQLFQAHPKIALPFLQERLQLSEAQVIASYQSLDIANLAQNRGMLSGSNAGLSYILKEVHGILKQANYLQKPLPDKSFYTDAFLPRGI